MPHINPGLLIPRMNWGCDDTGINIPSFATNITTPPSVKSAKPKRDFGLSANDPAPYTNERKPLGQQIDYARGLASVERKTGVSRTGSERGRHEDYYENETQLSTRQQGTKIVPGKSIAPKSTESLSALPAPHTKFTSQPNLARQTGHREIHIQKLPGSFNHLPELFPPLKITPSPKVKTKTKKNEVIDLVVDGDDDQSDEPSPKKPMKTSKLTTLVESRIPQLTPPTAAPFGRFPSIPIQRVFVGKKHFGDSSLCKLEIKASLRSFDLTLPDPTFSLPEIKAMTATTQLRNLSLVQKIHFTNIIDIIYATNIEMEISFIAFSLSNDIVWHSNLSIKCPASLDDDFLQEFDGEKYDFCPQAKEMDPSKYLVLIATADAVRDFHNWISRNGQELSSTYLNREIGGADQHSDQYLMAYHHQIEAENKEKESTAVGSRRNRRRKRVESTVNYDSSEARRTVFRYPMIEGAQDVITICGGDVLRLTDGEFLNDNMVDLQIKRLVIWKKYYDLHKKDEFQDMSEKDCWNHFNEKYISSVTPVLKTTSDSGSPVTITESDHNTSPIYAFSSMFYQKLTERKRSESYELVKKWTKNVDLFSKEFIFIPINMGSHWSLLCIVRPGLIRKESSVTKASGSGKKRKRSTSVEDDPTTPGLKLVDDFTVVETLETADEIEIPPTPSSPDPSCSVQTNENVPCILFMDSLGIHGAISISNTIYSYLESEWRNRKQSEREFNRTTMPLIDCKSSIPKQINSYDCGLYVTMYAKMICMLSPPSTEQEIQTKFREVFSSSYFSPEDVSEERKIIKKFCERCETEWEDFKEKRRSEKKKEEESEEEGKESHPTPIEYNECKEAEVEVEAKKCLPEPNSSDEIPTESAESLNGSSARSQGRKQVSRLGEIFGEEHIS